MWETYEPPERREPPSGPPPSPPAAPPRFSQADEFGPALRAAGQSRGVGAAIGIVAVVISAAVSIGVASSVDHRSTQPDNDHSGWYDCLAEERGRDNGLLSAEDLCEIGNDPPPGYVDDDHDAFDESGYGGSYGS